MEENLGRPGVWPETDQQIERGSQGQVARRVPDADEEDEDAGGGEQSEETVFGEEVGVYEESADWREKIAVENETELYEDETGAAAEKAEQREKSGEAGRGEEAVGSGEEGEFAGAGEEERSGKGFERRMRYYVTCFELLLKRPREREKEGEMTSD